MLGSMSTTEDGLRVIQDGELDQDDDALEVDLTEDHPGEAPVSWRDGPHGDPDLESLRAGFIDAFNGRDLDSLLGLMSDDVECPDISGDGLAVLAEEIESIWERSPATILTTAFLDDSPCAVAWLPDEDGCWSRAALVCFDSADDRITLVALPEDSDGLQRAETEEPTGEELDEWTDWAEWDRGEETLVHDRQ